MPTESEIQKCKKILFDEVGQNDEWENAFDELWEILKKIKPTCNSLSEAIDEFTMSPEIVAFIKAKNIPQELLGYFKKEAVNFDPAPRTCEESFKMGLRLGREFSVLNKESTVYSV